MLQFNEASPDIYPLLKDFARKNRLNMTLAENVLWQHIRNNALGHKFLRQYIIGDFIVDFICRDEGLIIEVDGAYHSEPSKEEDDKMRDDILREHGYHVLRFSNNEILNNLNCVIDEIDKFLNT